ncbi:MAG TPA: hypothetical protein VD731_07915 [Nitrosopumilaceae archaeon]|nr:hypothetical protein [Nitrosopumilaceae archaeon]
MNSSKNALNNILVKGTIIAFLITIPSLASFFITWYILNDVILAAITATIIHFTIMAFSFKISKKIFH